MSQPPQNTLTCSVAHYFQDRVQHPLLATGRNAFYAGVTNIAIHATISFKFDMYILSCMTILSSERLPPNSRAWPLRSAKFELLFSNIAKISNNIKKNLSQCHSLPKILSDVLCHNLNVPSTLLSE